MAIELTPDQKAALTNDRHVWVEAGAGTGKTTVLIGKILSIMSENPNIELPQILAITFTNDVAATLIARLMDLGFNHPNADIRARIQSGLPGARIQTIDGFCLSVIRQFGILAGIPCGITVLDSALQSMRRLQAIQTVIATRIASQCPDLVTVLTQWSMYRLTVALESRNFVSESDSMTRSLRSLLAHVETTYAEIKTAQAVMDYGDLLIAATQLVNDFPEIRHHYHTHIHHILIDEFQDTNFAQWNFLQQIANPESRSIWFWVGDIKQSIYRFRGADPTLFTTLSTYIESHPEYADRVTIRDNFRSAPALFDFINPFFSDLFSENNTIPYTHLRAAKSMPGAIEFGLCDSATDEWDRVAQWISDLHHRFDIPFSEIAILCRTHRPLTTGHHILSTKGIPSDIVTGVSIYRLPLVILITALLRWTVNHGDDVALTTILLDPIMGLTPEILTCAMAKITGNNLWSRLCQTPDWMVPDSAERHAWTRAHTLLATLDQMAVIKPVSTCIGWWLTETDAWKWVYRHPHPDRHLYGMRLILAQIEKFSHEMNTQASIDTLMYHIAKGTTVDLPPGTRTGVQLMTIHKSKGLEFTAVVLPNLDRKFSRNRSQFGGKSTSDIDDYEEEKRLFYVGCTRAKQYLLLSGTVDPEKPPAQPAQAPLDWILNRATWTESRIRLKGSTGPSAEFSQVKLTGAIPVSQVRPVESAILSDSSQLIKMSYSIPITQTATVTELVQLLCGPFQFRPNQASDHQKIGTAIHRKIATRIRTLDPSDPDIESILTIDPLPRIATHAHFVEQPFCVRLGDWIISGRWDLLLATPTGWEIIDFKTGKVDIPISDYYRTQMTIYAYALRAYFPDQSPIQTTIIDTTQQVSVPMMVVDHDITALTDRLNQIAIRQ